MDLIILIILFFGFFIFTSEIEFLIFDFTFVLPTPHQIFLLPGSSKSDHPVQSYA